jgi:hypothetical protein
MLLYVTKTQIPHVSEVKKFITLLKRSLMGFLTPL